jgi:hypothetical protein
MRRSSQQGIALVITLIMLAVVTVMAIIFLGLSRRERAAVSVTADLTTARLMADTARTRAQSEILARIAAHSNLFAYDLLVSTNFINRNGFQAGLGTNPVNVAYHYPPNPITGGPLNARDLRRNLANLWYDPRPPVFVVTNFTTGAEEFRFYLDVNRNGFFETNGWIDVMLGGVPNGTNFVVGDPEWIGVLEYPDRPHSASNQFVGRYAFVVLPTGKSLDINYGHNSAETTAAARFVPEGYFRNQGVGSWELNFAAFFESLLPLYYENSPYRYVAGSPLAPYRGWAFDDARAVLNHRQDYSVQTLRSVQNLFGLRGANAFLNHRLDGYGDGPLVIQIEPFEFNGSWDNPTKLWWGSDAIRSYSSVQDFFDSGKFIVPGATATSTNFQGRLTNAVSRWYDTEYRYAYTTLLAQMGVDSAPARRDKLHLNYANVERRELVDSNNNVYLADVVVPHLATNFTAWLDPGFDPHGRVRLFTNIVERLFQQTYGAGLREGIQIYPTNNYDGAVHRLLQVAANIVDATTNRLDLSLEEPFFPSVFRPLFRRSGTNVVIGGYAEVTNELQLLQTSWIERTNTFAAFSNPNLLYHANVYGVPVVIAARKGWPNFNEFHLQNSVQLTRRMEAYRPIAGGLPRLNQSYEIGVSNHFGVESWNAYTQAFPRALQLSVTNVSRFVLRDTLRVPGSQVLIDRAITNVQVTNFNAGDWRGGQFQVSSRIEQLLPNSEYWPLRTPPFRQVDGAVAFDETSGFPIPDFKLEITNRLTVLMTAVDRNNNRRVVDFVNLDSVPGGFDVTENLVGRTNVFSARGLDAGSFWMTNRMDDVSTAATFGITNQLYVSTNDVLARSDWRSLTENPVSGQQKEKAIDDFRLFMGLPALFDTRRTQPPVGPRVQVPFSPSRILDQVTSWQANDPLVHYHVEDLFDQQLADLANVVPRPPGSRPPTSNLGRINERYRPWGGRPGSVGDEWAYHAGVKDPGMTSADKWDFPTNQFPTIGWLGRVHRGSPWQTIYLKSAVVPVESWVKWSNRAESHPTNDWAMLELFTTAINDNAARGLLSVNQTNLASWTAVLAGIPVLTNTMESVNLTSEPEYGHLFIEPNTPQMRQIVESINATRQKHFNQTFRHLGHVLSAPGLTLESPFLNREGDQALYGITDAMYEWIPQQILSLLREDEPYVVVYAYGQSLRPADRSILTAPGEYFGLCTNYQITSEVLTKTALRFEEIRQPDDRPSLYKAHIESHHILPTD